MALEDREVWFRAKRYGIGWSAPTCWQGWVALIGYVAAVGIGARVLIPARGHRAFAEYAVLVSLIFLYVCWRKGESLRWRWGGE